MWPVAGTVPPLTMRRRAGFLIFSIDVRHHYFSPFNLTRLHAAAYESRSGIGAWDPENPSLGRSLRHALSGTELLLVLRLYYEEAFKRYEMNDAGEIEVDGETILQVYEERTHRTRPLVTRVHEILTTFRQRGLLRVVELGDSRSFTLFLRPALPIVVGEDTLASLDEFVARSEGSEASDVGPDNAGAMA